MTMKRIRFQDSTDVLGHISKVFKGESESDRIGTIRSSKYFAIEEGLNSDPVKGYSYESTDSSVRISHKNLIGLKRKLRLEL